jgi:hypothetical protein
MNMQHLTVSIYPEIVLSMENVSLLK